ncbi:hypothetical protein ACNJYA_20150 [Bradyrhizobium sp. DASA03068]|uniref:hypothetical protein n=1 Tax=Bradyrhizobium sp. BLXBL-01 TaxID=3395915 RepID=UPI003F724837
MQYELDERQGFEDRLRDAGRILHFRPEELFSIKIRPLFEDEGGRWCNVYLSPEYEDINKTFGLSSVPATRHGYGCQGVVWICELGDGHRCLYVEHETGPEIILHDITMVASAAGATLFAANQALRLINNTCKLMREKTPPRDKKGRFVSASIEKRLANTQKIIRLIERTAKATEKAVRSIEELFK